MNRLRFCLAQINSTVGDFNGNLAKIAESIEYARKEGCAVVCFPELALCGYPPEDLLFNPSFIRANSRYIKRVVDLAADIVVICGYVGSKGDDLFNSAVVAESRKSKLVYNKVALPNYGVFDEKRYFTPGTEVPVLRLGEISAGLNICEDIWVCPGVTERQAEQGAKLIINISASPYHMRRVDERIDLLRDRSRNNRCHIAYVNLVGGQDELVFDGASMVVDPAGKTIVSAKPFVEERLIVDLELAPQESERRKKSEFPEKAVAEENNANGLKLVQVKLTPPKTDRRRSEPSVQKQKKLSLEEEVFGALVLGTRDYIKKNNFSKALIGLSGGLDSALTLAVAVEAIGADVVSSIFMPSQYTSTLSYRAAQHQADLLGCSMDTVSIDQIYDSYMGELAHRSSDFDSGITSENLQARIRGSILMAFSNHTGAIVLNTSNKSEAAVGYTTLYGDMVGGFSVLKDIPKSLVYAISRHLNRARKREVISRQIIKRPPTAELKADQKDSDSLPPYDTLDEILRHYVELDLDEAAIVKKGYDRKTVRRVIRMVINAEHKRRQSPPGIKITPRAFGRDRRWPITNSFLVVSSKS